MGSRHVQVLGSGMGTIRISPPTGIPMRRMSKTRLHAATGKSKGLVPTQGERIMARRSRSYKSVNEYEAWCKKFNGVTKVRGSGT